MKLRTTLLGISTGGVLVSVVNTEDAQLMDLHSQDRLKLIKDDKIDTVITNTGTCDCSVQPGTIGVFKEAAESLGLHEGDYVDVQMARKPLSLDYIKKKLQGLVLSGDEIRQIIWDIVHNKLSEIELTYFVAACYTNPLNSRETVDLVKAMTEEGEIFSIDRYPIVDKHCIGGVAGNRTSMLIVPILAAAGCTIPKTSSRSITSPAGTADTMEVLCDVNQGLEKMKHLVEKHNGCLVWGGSLNLAPADDKIIHVEKPLVIDARSQLLASILSKKLSVSSTHILIDIPVGPEAKFSSMEEAKSLKEDFEKMSDKLGVTIRAVITDGSAPIGRGIGPALEARDVLWVLENDERQPGDLREKAIRLAGIMLEMAGKARERSGEELARSILADGRAHKTFLDIIRSQGARCETPDNIHISEYVHEFKAGRSGTVREIRNQAIAKIARIAGAPLNHGAGLMLEKKVGEQVEEGEVLFRIYGGSEIRLQNAVDIANSYDSYVID